MTLERASSFRSELASDLDSLTVTLETIHFSIRFQMFLDSVAPNVARQDRSRQRQALLDEAVSIFARCFPSVRYRVLGSVNVVNAQASVAPTQRLVDLFGGLAFHRSIGHDGLVWTLLHETGHHLGRGSRLPWADMACECSADRWALTEGRKRLQTEGVAFDLFAALRQIELAARPGHAGRGAKPNATACGSMNWRKRKQALVEGKPASHRRCGILGSKQA